MATAITVKLLYATFFNTAIIVLIVNAKIPNIGLFSSFQWLFQGDYTDFYREWYSAAGVGIFTTMIINIIAPQLAPMF